jgi:hypothetical protein
MPGLKVFRRVVFAGTGRRETARKDASPIFNRRICHARPAAQAVRLLHRRHAGEGVGGIWAEDDTTYAATADGWPRILSRLKTLIETGKTFKPH